MDIEEYCTQLHSGQWFTFQDPKTGKTKEKSLDTLRLTEYGEKKGYKLPTKEEFEAWKVEKQKELEEQKIINKRKAEYGSPEEQLEFITENGLEAWKKKVSEIKQKYPK